MKKVSILLAISAILVFNTGLATARDHDGRWGDISFGHDRHAAVCVKDGQDSAYCNARVILDANGQPHSNLVPSGYGPAQFHAAYSAQTAATSNQIIAIVDAYDDPNILKDLNTYSSQFGIPTMLNCSQPIKNSSTPCFQKVNQTGGTNYPYSNSGWALEISLDVEVAHAMCQNCRILLVEANSSSYSNLLAAEDEAAKLGATVISNSWGSNEFSSEITAAYDNHFNKPGIAITFSSGDSGYGAEYPAASSYVTAVGGTTLLLNPDGSYATETAWSGSGSGCSLYEAKPGWQSDTLCAKRTVADVSADADPNSGAAVYDSVKYAGQSGWFKVGGTSLSSPLIAGVYALAGGSFSPSLPYTSGNPGNLRDIINGSNGNCNNYLCTAGVGYDGPTGLGSPNGVTAF
jgi:subtilase family serine protease